MSGWGNEWPENNPEFDKAADVAMSKASSVPWPNEVFNDAMLHGIGFTADGKHVPLEKVYNNIMPTHDPYTNPNAIIYYECLCGAILDPGTKSFASLNNHASEKGWKIRFSDKGYIPYCVKCGEKVE